MSFWCGTWVFSSLQTFNTFHRRDMWTVKHFSVIQHITASCWANHRPSGTHSKIWQTAACQVFGEKKQKKNTFWSRASLRFTVYNCIRRSILGKAYRWRRSSIIYWNNFKSFRGHQNTTHELPTVASTSQQLILLFKNPLTKTRKTSLCALRTCSVRSFIQLSDECIRSQTVCL